MEFVTLTQGKAAADKVESVRKAAVVLARDGSNDPGTTLYEIYQTEDDPTLFVVFAIFKSEAAWKKHVESGAHEKFWNSLPEDAWEIHPKRTNLKGL